MTEPTAGTPAGSTDQPTPAGQPGPSTPSDQTQSNPWLSPGGAQFPAPPAGPQGYWPASAAAPGGGIRSQPGRPGGDYPFAEVGREKRSNTLAIVAIVIASLALLVGIMALAIASIASVASAALGGAYLEEPYAADFGDAALYGEYAGAADFTGVTSVDDLREGVCFGAVDIDSDLVATPGTLPCDSAHDYEVYAVSTVEGDLFPGEDFMYDETYPACEDTFEDFIGVDYYDSVVGYGLLAPTAEGWDDGERGVVCFAYVYDASRDSSLRGFGE
ncbi:septum formation family protein [Marisediminicola senii]|uniref:septum formation family protein n=1 Tax=Marisediminicola senii TaxID=2711233 RepID=UPI0013EA92E8|nr:septum formation family protein [Marisediminicola senii]